MSGFSILTCSIFFYLNLVPHMGINYLTLILSNRSYYYTFVMLGYNHDKGMFLESFLSSF